MCRLDFLTLQEFLSTLIIAEKLKPTIKQMNYLQSNHSKRKVMKTIFLFVQKTLYIYICILDMESE